MTGLGNSAPSDFDRSKYAPICPILANTSKIGVILHLSVTRNDGQLVPFGDLYVVNNALKLGINPTSKIIGRAKGLEVASSQANEIPTWFLCLDFGFSRGKFKGSSIIICSRSLVLEPERELAVIGGRKKFRMATGFAKVRTVFANTTDNYVVSKYDVTVYD
ncbi:dirigent protein 4-like [Mercurialis annua]|uniref:dirigent protein 4-like n=1 Tax=Mercurialis annua TaxID=3986 RepID=UPI00215DFF6C|nr:dirigent protein 4-like [Mercurialis annua]